MMTLLKTFRAPLLLLGAALPVLVGLVWLIQTQPLTRQAYARDMQRRRDTRLLLETMMTAQSTDREIFKTLLDADEVTVQLLGTGEGLDCQNQTVTCGAFALSRDTADSCFAKLHAALSPAPLPVLPVDPIDGSPANTGYYVNALVNGRLVVGACLAEKTTRLQAER